MAKKISNRTRISIRNKFINCLKLSKFKNMSNLFLNLVIFRKIDNLGIHRLKIKLIKELIKNEFTKQRLLFQLICYFLFHIDRIKNSVGLKIISLIFEPGIRQTFQQQNGVWNSTLKTFSDFMANHLKQAILLINENMIPINNILSEHENEKLNFFKNKNDLTMLTKRSDSEFHKSNKIKNNFIRSFQDLENINPNLLKPPTFEVYPKSDDLDLKYNNVLNFYLNGLISKNHVDHYLFLMSKVNLFRNELEMHQNKIKSSYIALKKYKNNHKTSSFLISKSKIESNIVHLNHHFSSSKQKLPVDNMKRI